MTEIKMGMFGDLEDFDNGMVVRILGWRVGTARGYIDIGGHAVLYPEFKRAPGLLKFMPDRDLPAKIGIAVDYYAGLMAIVEEPTEQVQEPDDLVIIWSTRITGGSEDVES